MSRVNEIRALAINPTHRGFGFVVFEGPTRLIDWGVRGRKGGACLDKMRELIVQYRPTVVVLENCADRRSRRSPRVRRLIKRMGAAAVMQGVNARFVSRAQVRRAFAPAVTKDAIALAITQQFPELAPFLPPPRKSWMSEDGRMDLFVAASFALAFFLRSRRERWQAVPDLKA